VQRLQLLVSFCRSTSQPSLGSPLQSANPGEQTTIWHAPSVQVDTALFALHALPHAPQLAASLVVFEQIVGPASPPHSVWPGGHV
jgi:hypothetical protein